MIAAWLVSWLTRWLTGGVVVFLFVLGVIPALLVLALLVFLLVLTVRGIRQHRAGATELPVAVESRAQRRVRKTAEAAGPNPDPELTQVLPLPTRHSGVRPGGRR